MIETFIENKIPTAVGKIGASESKSLYLLKNNIPHTPGDLHNIFTVAGVFPPTLQSLQEFQEIYWEILQDIDILAQWRFSEEEEILNYKCPNVTRVTLRSLEPYYSDAPWSQKLEGLKVLVISPFTNSIQKQYKRRELIWGSLNILPEFELITLKCPHSHYIQESEFNSWLETLNFLKLKMEKLEFDVCIIGAGAWSLPLASQAKKQGAVGIHLGGATQILFGIRGNRWDSHEIISTFYNEHWVRPSAQESPSANNVVENGCYW